MRFELKVLLTFTVVLTLGISILNVVSFMFYKFSVENLVYEKAKLYFLLKKENSLYKPLDYILISDKILFNEDLQFLFKKDGKYVYIKSSYIRNKLINFSKILFLWDMVVVLSLMFLIHITIVKYLKKEKLIKNYLELILLTISHKLGNFLSVQKVNLEIIKEKCNIRAIDRLILAFNFIEKDFKTTLNLIKNIEREEKTEEFNIEEVIKKLVDSINLNKNVKLSLKKLKIKINREDLENILYILLENAFKYADKYIHIKVCKNHKEIIIAIKNDIGNYSKGSGIGLELAKYLAKKNEWKLITKTKKDFLAILKIKT